MPAKDPKLSVHLSVYVPHHVRDALRVLGAARGEGITRYIRRILVEHAALNDECVQLFIDRVRPPGAGATAPSLTASGEAREGAVAAQRTPDAAPEETPSAGLPDASATGLAEESAEVTPVDASTPDDDFGDLMKNL